MWDYFLVYGAGLISGFCLAIAAIVTVLKLAMKMARSRFKPKT